MAQHRSWGLSWGGLVVLVAVTGCGSSDDDAVARETALETAPVQPGLASSPAEGEAAEEGRPDAPPSGVSADSASSPGAPAFSASDESAPAVPPIGGGDGQVQSGTLTAGAWDDSRNLDRFLDYRSTLVESQLPGLPEFDEQAHRDAATRAAQLGVHTTLDIALVVDTTGSMGDELAYLQTEFEALSSAIEAQYPGAEQRWALVVYKDVGDEYTAQAFDFEAAGSAFRDRLAAQSAGGGGDYPEAADAALEAMNQLGWRSDAATARLAFWVGDAPHHEGRSQALADAVTVAAGQDVHLYPVASSGVDELTEYTMRSAAQLTLGRYLFLTDDSGVGGEHKEPTIPCYFVTRLDDAILRMVDIEMTGVYQGPLATDVLRTGGNPAEGACTLESGQTVFAF
jgi:hypothetical protein